MAYQSRKKIDKEFIDRARERLNMLANSTPTKGISRKETVAELSNEIRKVIEKHGIEAAVAALNSDEITFPAATITTYMHQLSQMADVQAMRLEKPATDSARTAIVVDGESATNGPMPVAPASANETPTKPKKGGKRSEEIKKNTDTSETYLPDRKTNSSQTKANLTARKGSFDIKDDSEDL